METRQKPGAGEGYDRLIRVKMTWMAGDPPDSVHITVQIFIFRDNPLKYTDPDGRTDYIYSDKDTYKTENDWGFWEFLHKDRYFVETEDGTRYRANSKETVELYDWKEIDTGFLNDSLPNMVDQANQKDTNFKRIWDESAPKDRVGELDFKQQLREDTLYLANGILYDKNEAGNFVWAYFLESKGYGGLLPGILAQGGSLFAYPHSRFDESWDVRARHAGQRYYRQKKQ
jgi:hypothetical protein